MMNKDIALEKAKSRFEDGSFAKELARRVALRTVSQGEENGRELIAYIDEVLRPDFESMGFSCRVLENPVAGAAPFLFAERIESPDALTVLSYGHGDVVPGYDDQWMTGFSPWEMKLHDGAWYGRGVADNKGQHTINLTALKTVIDARGGRLGYNVKMLFELGEERSSPGLRQVCKERADELAADLFIASDGPRTTKDSVTLFLGSRGHVIFELVCALRDGGLHSGNWGGIVKNPAVILANAIGSLVDGKGRIRVKGLLPPPIPESVRDALARLPISAKTLGGHVDETWGEPGLSVAERLLGWNTLEVLTLQAGAPAKPTNAIPPSAAAHCQLRFVVGTPMDRIAAMVREHLDAEGFEDVQVKVVRGAPATRLDPGSPWVNWARKAIRSVIGVDPLVTPNLGGTVPNDAFSETLGLPTIWIPHSYPGCRQHAANEHLPLSIAREGLLVMTSVFWELGEEDAFRTWKLHRQVAGHQS